MNTEPERESRSLTYDARGARMAIDEAIVKRATLVALLGEPVGQFRSCY